MVIEPVLDKIRLDETIKGINLPNRGERKLLAYVDDTILFQQNNDSINRIMETFEEFGLGSGSKSKHNKIRNQGNRETHR